MTMNILAILISFAMMLSGVGGEGQPAEASRTLMIHNVNLTFNDQSVDLEPSLRLGAYSDGKKAVFDVGVQTDEETLFPIQLGVSEEGGITALFEKSDVAVNVSAEALNNLADQANQMIESLQGQMTQGENPELMTFITQEFLPAYTGLIEAVQDPDFIQQVQEQANAAFAEIIDRGEGTPVTETIDGEEIALTAYSYTIESDKLAELTDAVYASNDALKNYYDVIFKLYAMMPVESGLNELTSFKDLFEKTGLSLTMDVEEKLSDDGKVDIMDGVMTLDMGKMIHTMAAQAENGENAQPVEIPPMQISIHSAKNGDAQEAEVGFAYEIPGEGEDGVSMEMNVTGSSDDGKHGDMQMTMDVEAQGERMMGMDVNARVGTAGGGETYDVSAHMNVMGNDEMYLNAHGIQKSGGICNNSFSFDISNDAMNFGLSFDADVVDDPIEDKVNGHEAAVTLSDLSQESLNALGQDQALQNAMMQVVGSLGSDAQKLMADENVQQLVGLFAAIPVAGAVADDYVDDSFEGEETEEYEYQEPVDDGELGYNVPEFTWLPEGWTVMSTDQDTQYDWVSMTIGTPDYSNSMYATFYKNEDNVSVNYVVGGDGEIEAVDGREITVTDFGDGSVSVNLHEENVDGNLSFYSEGIDVETIGKIVAGLQF